MPTLDETEAFVRRPGQRPSMNWFAGRASVAAEAKLYVEEISDLVLCLHATAHQEDGTVSALVVRTMAKVLDGEISALLSHL